MKKVNGQVIIYGKKGHAEVIGLTGQINDEAIIISQFSELEKIDFSRPISIFAQTTQKPENYQAIINEINNRIQKSYPENKASLTVTDSICRHVSKRSEQLKEFAVKHDVIIFISGTDSSNGKVLFDICLVHNPNSFWIPNDNEIDKDWFTNMQTVGICGATSTPRWLMEKVAGKIKEIINN
jgi:4-hydroxy-3-methylbut-2-enyl diphosphate reductase